MPQVINSNFSANNAQRNLNTSQGVLATSIQRLSSGLRVNSAKDDAAGLAISERMHAQVRGMNVAIRNANDGISMAQTAEGALNKMTDALQRMRELSLQARNATNSDSDKDSLDQEFGQLAQEIQRIAGGTTFNGQAIIGADAGTLTYQIGADTTTNDTIDVTSTDLTIDATITVVAGTDNLGAGRAVIDNTATTAAIGTVIDNIDIALDTINSQRATYGAVQNRFEAVIGNLTISAENVGAARGRIVDADYAAESASLTRGQILQQAGTAMLAQANQIPQGVMQLLRG